VFVFYEYAWPIVKCKFGTYSMLLKILFCTTYSCIASRRTHSKHVHFLGMDVYCCPERASTGPLPSNGYPSTVERLCHGNVFTEPLPSHWHMRHNIKYFTSMVPAYFEFLINIFGSKVTQKYTAYRTDLRATERLKFHCGFWLRAIRTPACSTFPKFRKRQPARLLHKPTAFAHPSPESHSACVF
jgi:hypothetical protein